MARSKHLRMFLAVAEHRLRDADFLLGSDRTLAAAYLAGYAVECQLKALVLSQVLEHEQKKVIETFRGLRGHNFDWLRSEYRQRGGANFPQEVLSAILGLDNWETALRYKPTQYYPGDIKQFFQAVRVIMEWSKGRI